jgi:hypothetical protein
MGKAVFIVQGRPRRPEGINKVVKETRAEALEAARDLLDNGMVVVLSLPMGASTQSTSLRSRSTQLGSLFLRGRALPSQTNPSAENVSSQIFHSPRSPIPERTLLRSCNVGSMRGCAEVVIQVS